MKTIEPLTHAKGSSNPKARLFMAFWHRAIGALKIAIKNPASSIPNPASVSAICYKLKWRAGVILARRLIIHPVLPNH